ncbi:MAG: YnfA family protein [Caulobacteraceae bacterium]
MSILIYIAAAVCEIAGCFGFWMWLRDGKSPLWAAAAILPLAGFAWLLTRIETDVAARAFAAYGGIYIAASLVWMFAVEHQRPDRWDLIGGALAIGGTLVILYGRRLA